LWVISRWAESKIRVMLNNAAERSLSKFLAIGSAGITIFILTGSVSDPVNATKFLLLGGVAFASFGIFCSGGWSLIKDQRIVLGISFVFVLASFNAIVNSSSPVQQNFYGTYGRNTGFLTYLFLLLIFIAATSLRSKRSFDLIIVSLIVSGMVNVIYCLYVLTFGDFVGWNNPYGNILGTFGNPNFIGAFLGFFASALVAYSLTKNVSIKIRILTFVTAAIILYEIVESKAIQGRVVFAGGLAIVGFYLIRSKFKSRIVLFLYSAGVTSAGFIAMLGALQIGPLTQFIYKTSVSLRGEYWQAGINMAKTHLLTGVGYDSYGDWYRRSRDDQALVLPGPDTVTNAAHNVPIDVFAFGGLPLLIPYLALIALVAIAIVRHTLKYREYDGLFVALTTAWVGYQIQSIISINQIGLAIWGWLLGGALLAYTKNYKSAPPNEGKEKNQRISKRNKNEVFSPQLIGGLMMVLGLLIASPPVSADAKFRSALNSSQIAKIEEVLTSSYLTPTDTFRLLNAIQILEQNKLFDLSYKYSKKAVEFNPESFDAWKIFYSISKSTVEEKKQAKLKMIALDPLNKALQNLP
jgi:hypothetical protein